MGTTRVRTAATNEPETVPEKIREQIHHWYYQGQMMKAWEAAKAYGMPGQWRGVRSRTWAGRLAANLGASRLSNLIHWQNARRHPGDTAAAAYCGHALIEMRGPLVAKKFLEAVPEPGPETDADSRQYFFTLKAMVAAEFRDFENAEKQMIHARACQPDNPWRWVCEARLLEKLDRNEDALAAARRSLENNPLYRPGVQETAHLLQVLDRDEEALALLKSADRQMESGPITAQLAVLQMELELLDDSLASYDRYLNLSPLNDEMGRMWITQNRIAIACRIGDLDRAKTLCRERQQLKAKDPYYDELLKRLEQPEPARRRVKQEVDFVRQHHLTCAPATLSALSRFFKHPANHLELAEAICYDGTPCQSERGWAEKNGFLVREFTVTWDSARALLDRGIPFTLTTPETTSSHLQAVVGYDELRRSLLIRDPYFYYHSEALCPQFLERYAASGPRGMAMVPQSYAQKLDGLELPDAALYDQLHRVYCALDKHQREAAVAALHEMETAAPGHRLTANAGWAIAAYDSNLTVVQQHLDGLLKLFPKQGSFLLSKLGCLTEQAARHDRLEFLENLVENKIGDPVFLVRLASELSCDARELPRALKLVRLALRCRPTDTEFLRAQANLLWDTRDFDQATEFYRLAACGADLNEHCARAYFSALRHQRQTEAGIAFLRQRYERLRPKSAHPTITLFECLVNLDRAPEAFEVLEEALKLRPDDGELLLYQADAAARFRKLAQAEEFLTKAEGRARRTDWLRTAALVADYQVDRPRALALWQEVRALEPLALDANRQVARLLAQTQDQAAADAHLNEVCQRFPRHCGLLRLRAEFAGQDGIAVAEPALRQLLAANPADSWATRELALKFAHAARLDEALAEADRAVALNPQETYSHSVRGEIQLAMGRVAQAQGDFEQALKCSVDNGYAMSKLVEIAATAGQRRAALDFIQAELVRQVVFDDALPAFYTTARGVLEPEAVLARFREAFQSRPDLWSAWSVLVAQLTDMNLLDEALDHIRRACERFPFVPRLWVERARVHTVRGELAESIAALKQALTLNPAYGRAASDLADLYEKNGQFEESRQTLELASAQSPLDPGLHGGLADILWQLGQKEKALERLQHALRLEPGYQWGWSAMRQWAAELDKPDLPEALARDLTQKRAGEARSWMILADCLAGRDEAGAVNAADRAIQLNPRNDAGWNLKARLLAGQNRFEDALACCQPEAIVPPTPLLRIRAAWVEAQRGRLNVAITKMDAVLEEHPANYWGWQLLADWHTQLGNFQKGADAADQMARLAPQDSIPLGYAGDLLLRKGDKPGAIDRFRRAVKLNPKYTFAGLHLIDLLLEKGDREDLAEAAEIIALIKPHESGDFLSGREALLALRQENIKTAKEIFARLCRLEKPQNGWSLFRVAEESLNAGLRQWVTKEIDQALQEEPVNPHLGALWIQQRFKAKKYHPDATLHQFARRGGLGRNLLGKYLDLLAEEYGGCYQKHLLLALQLKRYLRQVLKQHRELLAGDDLLWAKTGHALRAMGLYRQACEWLADWRQHKEAEPWMIFNLALALVATDRPAEAADVIGHALAQQLDPELFDGYANLAAVEAALAGDLEQARRLLEPLRSDQLNDTDKAFFALAQALVYAANNETESRWQLTKRLRADLMAGFSGYRPYQFDQTTRRLYWRSLRQLGQAHRLPLLRLWGAWHFAGAKWLLVASLPILVPCLFALGPLGWIIIWQFYPKFRLR